MNELPPLLDAPPCPPGSRGRAHRVGKGGAERQGGGRSGVWGRQGNAHSNTVEGHEGTAAGLDAPCGTQQQVEVFPTEWDEGVRARAGAGRGGAGAGPTHAWRRRGGRAPPPPGTCARRGTTSVLSGGRGGASPRGGAPERAVGAGPAGHRPGAAPEHRPGRHPPGGRGARAPARPRGAHRRHFFRRLVWGSLSVCLSVWRVEQCNPGEGAGVEVLLGAKGRVLGSPGAVVVSCFAVHPHSSTPRESFPSEERFTSEEQGAHLHRALEPSR